MMCRHFPPCPVAMAPDAAAAKVISSHQEQGWSLLCNGAVLFDDGGLLLPDIPDESGPTAGQGRREACGLSVAMAN